MMILLSYLFAAVFVIGCVWVGVWGLAMILIYAPTVITWFGASERSASIIFVVIGSIVVVAFGVSIIQSLWSRLTSGH